MSSNITQAQDDIISRRIITYSDHVRDSLSLELATEKDDNNRVWLLYDLSGIYRFNRPDSGIYYGIKAWELARKINYPAGQVAAIRFIAISHIALGLKGRALQWDLEGIKLADQYGLLAEKVILLNHLGEMYSGLEDYATAIKYFKASVVLSDSAQYYPFYVQGLSDTGASFLKMGDLDSAKFYTEMAFTSMSNLKVDAWTPLEVHSAIGAVYQEEGELDSAHYHFRQSFEKYHPDKRTELLSTIRLAEFFYKEDMLDSSKRYAEKALIIAREGDFYINITQASNLLSDIYKEKDTERSLKFKTMAMAYQDSLLRLGQTTAFENLIDFDEQKRQQELSAAEEKYQSQLRTNTFLGSSFTLIVIALLLYRNNRAKQKSKQKIENAYDELKSTQTQLIHSEKMASLGELTAGIAHEIQNPLNFVNNFSDVNMELIVELNEAHAKGDKAEIEAITKDILENESKVAHHGKRAEAIVKSMLQHSRGSDGVKEPTDINALADEYLRLAYHGLRAKDQSFNAEFKTDFDENLPKIEVVPQDIGRVLLNLINNAFQAVKDVEKPEVKLETKKLKNSITISVADNGPGIPDDIKDKIFQPFFTTKPTGEGTGLGLSMSYDIVTKGHGGELELKSEEGKGTEFIVKLPIR